MSHLTKVPSAIFEISQKKKQNFPDNSLTTFTIHTKLLAWHLDSGYFIPVRAMIHYFWEYLILDNRSIVFVNEKNTSSATWILCLCIIPCKSQKLLKRFEWKIVNLSISRRIVDGPILNSSTSN